MKVYAVKQEWQESTGGRYSCVLGVCSTQEEAQEVLRQERNTLISESYKDYGHIIEDVSDHFTIEVAEFEKWDEITIEESELATKTINVYMVSQTTFSEFRIEMFEKAYKTLEEAVNAAVNYICETSKDEATKQERDLIYDTFMENLCCSDGEDYYEIHIVEVEV